MTTAGDQEVRRILSFLSLLVIALVLLGAATATAQEAVPQPPPLQEEPIGWFVVDARGVMANFKPTNLVAPNVGLTEKTDLPGRGFGLSVGAHVYPLRLRRFAIGVGADMLLRARGSKTEAAESETAPDGPTVVTRMTAFSPQVSLNFGKRTGWSYVSVGTGPASLVTELADDPFPDAEDNPLALNYGGGARWFAKKHLAFTFDVRFYSVNAQAATATRPAYPKVRVTILSAGISVR
jgi:hypothetical protein